jgi:hypothetical protein
MVKYGMNNIATFDCVTDRDMAIVKIIREKYNNSNFIRQEILHADEYFLRCLLIMRKDINPLSVVLKKEYLSSADDILEELLASEDIYDKLSTNAIYSLLNMYMTTNGVITCDILCKNEQEEHYIKSLEDNNVGTIVGDIKKVNVSSYDSFFVRDYRDILKFNVLKGKYIYVPTYAFNFEEDEKTPLLSVSVQVADINIVKTLCPYPNFILPEKEKED